MQISVKVFANSKRSRLEKGTLADLYAYVNQPALDGRANEAVVEALAGYYGVKKYQIKLMRGQ